MEDRTQEAAQALDCVSGIALHPGKGCDTCDIPDARSTAHHLRGGAQGSKHKHNAGT